MRGEHGGVGEWGERVGNNSQVSPLNNSDVLPKIGNVGHLGGSVG